jgi:hypothetical protein
VACHGFAEFHKRPGPGFNVINGKLGAEHQEFRIDAGRQGTDFGPEFCGQFFGPVLGHQFVVGTVPLRQGLGGGVRCRG